MGGRGCDASDAGINMMLDGFMSEVDTNADGKVSFEEV